MDGGDGSESSSQQQALSADQQAQQNQTQQHQQYLGDITQGLPEFEDLVHKGVPLPGREK